MNALPSFMGLMKAQAAPRLAAKVMREVAKPHLTTNDTLERRERLGFSAVRWSKKTGVPGVSYLYRGKHNSLKHEFMVIEQQAMPPVLHFEPGSHFLPAWKMIVSEVAKKHGLEPRQLRSKSRFKEIMAARQEACYRIHKETPLSLTQIASKIGYADHTTVHHSIRRHMEREGLNA